MTKRLAVTGAAGFIGSHLVDALLNRGHEVVALDRRDNRNPIVAANLARAVQHSGLRLHQLDLADAELGGLLSGVDVVFHLAGVPGVRDSWGRQFDDYVRSNITGTQRLLNASEQAGVRRLVLASSSSVYGDAGRPSSEFDPTTPISPYGVSKLAAEQLSLAHARRADTTLSVVALRYFTVFGPRQRPGMAINQALLGCLLDVPIPLFGDGSQHREFTYIDDVIAATLAAANVEADAEVFNIGGGVSTSMREVFRLAEAVTGRTVPVERMPEQAGDVPATCADLRRAREFLGYRPSVELKEGMRRQASWLVELPAAVRDALLPRQIKEFQ
ncbi:NAD-dependent epimerase/dehydratase family protein [Nocardia gamkensis]|uniref:NAD-dependent epimerase/dehydratase family protein n=1 Tax=Nocardia gamkensis TaxID=352869 RepID=UPI0037C6D244